MEEDQILDLSRYPKPNEKINTSFLELKGNQTSLGNLKRMIFPLNYDKIIKG